MELVRITATPDILAALARSAGAGEYVALCATCFRRLRADLAERGSA